MHADDPSPGPGRLTCLAVFLVVLIVFMLSRHAAAGSLYFAFVNEASCAELHFPLQVANAELWKEGLPLWDPWSACGTPQLATYQSWVFFPLSALYLVLPALQAAELMVVARLVILGLGCMALARHLGLSAGAGLFLALGLAFNELTQRLAADSLLNTEALLPWTILAFLQLGRSGRLAPALAATGLTALHLLGGLPEATFFVMGFVVLTYLHAAFLGPGRQGWGGAWRKLGVLLAVAVGGTALAAVQVLPFLEHLAHAWSPHLEEMHFSHFKAAPAEVPALAYPYLPGWAELPPPGLSFGAVVLLFFVRGLWRSSQRGLALFMAGFGVLSTLKVFGVQPLHSIGRLPVLDMLAFPLYLSVPLRAAVMLVAALGFDDWWRTARDRSGFGLLVLTPLLLWAWWGGGGSGGGAWPAYPAILLGLSLAVLALLLLRARLSAPRAGWLLFATTALFAGELWLHQSRIEWRTGLYEEFFRPALEGPDEELRALLPSGDDPVRRFYVQGAQAPNAQLLWGPSLGFGYLNAVTVARYEEYRAGVDGLWLPEQADAALRLLRIAAVDTLVLRGERRERDDSVDLVRYLSGSSAPRWTGTEPVYEWHGRDLWALAEAPFELRLPRMELSSFDAVALRFRVEGEWSEPLVTRLALPGRAGDGELASRTLQPGQDGWRTLRASLPDGIRKSGLKLVVTGPSEPGPRFVMAELRLVRELHFPAERLEPVHEAPQHSVYRIEDALPRAYVVHAARTAQRSSVLESMEDPTFQPGREVVLEGPSPIPLPQITVAGSTARVVESKAKRVLVEVDAERDGLLVLSDTYYPGWVARVDGERRPIQAANLLFRAVPVEAGRHVVEFRYRPVPALVGAVVSVLSLAAFVALGALSRRRARSSPQTGDKRLSQS